MKKHTEKIYSEYEEVNNNNSFGEFLYKLRKRKGFTQLQLSEMLCVNNKTISKWENDINYPDASLNNKICEIFEITIEEYFKHKIDIEKRKKEKRAKKYNLIFIIFISILTPILFFLMIFYFKYVNDYKIYNIKYYYNDYNISAIGICVSNYNKSTLYIGKIKTYDYDIDKTDIINISYFYKDKLIYYNSSLDDIFIKSKHIKNCDINNVKIKIDILRKGKKDYTNSFNLIRTINKDNIVDKRLPDKNVKTKKLLLENGYIYNKKDDTYIKNINKNNINISITYILTLGKIAYLEKTKNYIKNIVYIENSNLIEVSIYLKENNTHILKERYHYLYSSKELICYTKICSSKKDIIKLMNEYIILLNSE